jgi:hypothetical protein
MSTDTIANISDGDDSATLAYRVAPAINSSNNTSVYLQDTSHERGQPAVIGAFSRSESVAPRIFFRFAARCIGHLG